MMNARVYTGTGTSRNGAPLLVEELSRHLHIPVFGIDEHEMRGSRAWETETNTLFFAGQSLGQFKAALGEDVMQRIRRSVYSGAFDYVGVCAGVALGMSHTKYRMKPVKAEHPEIKIQNTGLSMCYGLATGPCRSISLLPFSGEQENLFLIDLIDTTYGKKYNACFWGGPAIIPFEHAAFGTRQQLAVLKKDNTPLAIRAKFGAGTVSLFSFHPEINKDNIHRWAGIRVLSDEKAQYLEKLAQNLDGTAFKLFLQQAGLEKYIAYGKEAALAAPRYNFDSML